MKNLWYHWQEKLHHCWQYLSSYLLSLKTFLIQKRNAFIKVVIPVIILVLGFFSCSYSHRVVHQNIQSIFEISDAIRVHFMDKAGFWGLNTEYTLAQKIIPDKLIKNKKIVLSGGIEILIGSGVDADTVMPLVQNFDIVMPNLNRAQCISYAEAPLTNEQKLALISISIVNDKGSFIFEWGGKYSLPIDKYATKRLCQDKNNIIVWSLK